MIRKTLASFMIFIFVVFSIPAFIIYAFHGTFLDPVFYTEKINDESYDFLLRSSTQNMLDNNETLQQYFDFATLRNEISNVFTPTLFTTMMSDFANQFQVVKQDDQAVLSISFVPFRESLLTVAHNLAFKIYKQIPTCEDDETFTFNSQVLPACLPVDFDYITAMRPLSQNFENTIYKVIPADATVNRGTETQFIYNFFKSFDQIRVISLALLVAILGAIALILRRPFSIIIKYEALTFIFGGIAGFILSFLMPSQILNAFLGTNMSNVYLRDYGTFLLGFFTGEIQKLALIFLVLGLGLYLIFLFLKKSLD